MSDKYFKNENIHGFCAEKIELDKTSTTDSLVNLFADRYKLLRKNPSFETESFLGGLTPDQFYNVVDEHRLREDGNV